MSSKTYLVLDAHNHSLVLAKVSFQMPLSVEGKLSKAVETNGSFANLRVTSNVMTIFVSAIVRTLKVQHF